MFVENRWLTVGSSTVNSSRRRKTTICRWSSESNRNAAATRWWVDISPLRMQLSSNTESRVWVKAFRFASITSRIPNVISFLFCPPFSNDMAKIIVGVFCCCWCFSVQYPGGGNVVCLHPEQSRPSTQLQCHHPIPGQHFPRFARRRFHRAKAIESRAIVTPSFDHAPLASGWNRP